jgi:hypothetical protein
MGVRLNLRHLGHMRLQMRERERYIQQICIEKDGRMRACVVCDISCQDLQAEHINMRVNFLVLIVLLSWRWGLPITLYPGAPPSRF